MCGHWLAFRLPGKTASRNADSVICSHCKPLSGFIDEAIARHQTTQAFPYF